MEQREKIEYFAQYLPSLLQLEDAATAEAVCDVWQTFLDMSPWNDISQARFKEGLDNISLISHVNSTVECALAVSRIIAKNHDIDFDEQLIIAFGLLHDVDKVVGYTFNEENQLVVSEIGKKIQHGVYSAIIAHEKGFGDDMLHLLLTHTTDSKMAPQIKEGILFVYVDLCDWDLTRRYGKK